MNKSNILTQWLRTVYMAISLILMLSMLWIPSLADISAFSLHSEESESTIACTTRDGVATCHDKSSGVIAISADEEQQQLDDQPISQSQVMTTEEFSVESDTSIRIYFPIIVTNSDDFAPPTPFVPQNPFNPQNPLLIPLPTPCSGCAPIHIGE